ncbi:hypothetical protein AVEN_85822-1 [Araneus ventricosus]|uniref:Uncharacterized protein n=1 Tax=Araneus ventricosus TaxID=182803 RepID=A0A4Y2VQ49_ARAVE|nr:hypothetical protein AVEN_85822-1 [Araneus ventricosus]
MARTEERKKQKNQVIRIGCIWHNVARERAKKQKNKVQPIGSNGTNDAEKKKKDRSKQWQSKHWKDRYRPISTDHANSKLKNAAKFIEGQITIRPTNFLAVECSVCTYF